MQLASASTCGEMKRRPESSAGRLKVRVAPRARVFHWCRVSTTVGESGRSAAMMSGRRSSNSEGSPAGTGGGIGAKNGGNPADHVVFSGPVDSSGNFEQTVTGDTATRWAGRYFNGAGSCATCHSTTTGTFATVGSRFKGLALLQRMLYPGSGRDAGSTPAAMATVTTSEGKIVTGTVAYRDEFTIALTDSSARSIWSSRPVAAA